MLFDSDHAGDKIFGEVRAPLTVRQEPPDLAILREALALLHLNWRQYAHGGSTHLSAGQLEHLFALGFVIDQLQRNIVDLARCVEEWVR